MREYKRFWVNMGLLLVLVIAAILLALSLNKEKTPELTVKPGFLVTVHKGDNTYAVLDIKNSGNGDDTLLGASIDPKWANRVELHNSSMKVLESVDLPAGEEVLMTGEPHLMLIDAAYGIMVGEKVDITLDFEKSPDQTITFLVTESDGHNHKH